MLEDLLNLEFVFARNISIRDTLMIVLIAFILGLVIYYVYNKTYKGVMYSSSYGITLVMMTLITSLIIYAVTANFMLSLGMVGALSIVRYRTVIKEPIDLAYLFWAITTGILVGAGFLTIAVVGVIAIGVVLFIFVNGATNDDPYILVVSCQNDKDEKVINNLLRQYTKKYLIKAKSITELQIELTYEVRIKKSSTEFLNVLVKSENVKHANLVTFNGDYYM